MNNFLKLLVLAVLFVNCNVFSQSNKNTQNWKYEIEAAGTGSQGSYLIKVWSYSKKPVLAIEQAKKNAVHGIIFRGFNGFNGITGQKPLSSNSNLEIEKKEFFDPFFADGGKYLKFVNLSNDGSIAPEDRLKVGNQYKIGVIVSVNVTSLRKDLEDAGIIKGLSSGF